MENGKRIIKRLNKMENILEEIRNSILKDNDPDRLITVEDAASILRRTPSYIRQCIHSGELNAKKTARRYFLSLYEVRRLAGINNLEKKQTF